MSGVEFDSDVNSQSSNSGRPGSGYPFQQNSGEEKGITAWMIRKGLAKDTRMATIICVIVIIANAAIMLWSWNSDNAPTQRTDVKAQDMMPGHYVNSWRPSR